ncbi:PEGA domain-containing protein [Hyalangium sp.]|uniref:PEGA domain-containing protein n=1 Tax=Hyalangium sp. TaxID=2028555 RepID=UPI002D5C3A66|nr:PEGA domain-containing protein [Hyalangium sp.]HYH94361.1 PEGA domain-containing protein [Hyalangium sp.]
MRRPWNRVLQSALSGLLVGLLASGPALAQQPAVRLLPRVLPAAAAPKLTVLVVPLDSAAQAQLPRLSYLAEQAVAGAGRFELVRLADALDASGAREREAKAEEAAAAFAEGQKAYDELDTQKALQQFDTAAKLYELSDLSRHYPELARARVMKIASYVANGDNKAFARELKEVLARNPHAEFSPNYFPPDELALVEKTRKTILADATRTLEVKTGDVPAQIFVDGQFKGTSPSKLQDLTPAEHFVTAIAPGYSPAQGKFRGEASLTLQPVPAEPRLRAWVERISSDPLGEDRDAALRELGTLAGTQQVLALLVRGTPGAVPQDAIALRLDVSDGHNPGYAAAPLPLAGEVMDAGLQSLLAAVLKADAPRKDGPVKHYVTAGPSAGRRTAGYVLLATGAALVAGGVYFGLEASSKSDQFKRTPQRDSRAKQLSSDGKKFALIADVGILAGLVSAGAGTWLAFLGGGGGGKAEARKSPSEPRSSPAREIAPTTRPADKPATAPAGQPADKPATAPAAADKAATAPAPQGKPPTRAEEEKRKREEAAKGAEEERLKRAEEERLKREEEERLKREGNDKRKQEEQKRKQEEERLKREEEDQRKQLEEKRKREEEDKRKREEEDKRRREEEDKRKREEEEKKKRPPLDEDDLRNY